MKINQEQARRMQAVMVVAVQAFRDWLEALAVAVRRVVAAMAPLAELIRRTDQSQPFWISPRLDGRR